VAVSRFAIGGLLRKRYIGGRQIARPVRQWTVLDAVDAERYLHIWQTHSADEVAI
jgi:hypothetical protein